MLKDTNRIKQGQATMNGSQRILSWSGTHNINSFEMVKC